MSAKIHFYKQLTYLSRMSMRLNKYIAHCGICSRRKAVDLVKGGRVTVNGKVETNPAYEVDPKDKVKFDDKTVKVEKKKVYILMNKPKNTLTTVSDDRGRRTVLDIVSKRVTQRVYPVGRLDRNTTGLLLLTNDGDLAKKLSHPSHGVKKIYHATLDRNLLPSDLDKIARGIELEDGLAEVDHVGYADGEPKNQVMLELHSGRNRIIRRIFEHLDYTVSKLDRIYLGGLTKKDIPRGWFRELTPKELIMLKHFV
jgi:23S rRNA pseudouridine2605 synthase